MKKFNFIIAILSKVLEFLSHLKCQCCNSKCSSTVDNHVENIEYNGGEIEPVKKKRKVLTSHV